MNKTLAGIAAAGAIAFGASTITVQTTPAMIGGTRVYDTPSGTLEVGYYMVDKDGVALAHEPARLTATTTLPDGFYPEKVGQLAHDIGLEWVFYDKAGAVLGVSTDPTIATQIVTPGAPLPTIGVSVLSTL